MTQKQAYCLHRRKYAQISVKKRMAIIRLVTEQAMTLSEAGRKLHVNPSTVRLIIKKYEKTGEVFNKRLRNASRLTPPEQCDVKVKVEHTSIAEIAQEAALSQDIVKKEEDEEAFPPLSEKEKYTYPFLHYFYQC